MFSVVRVDTKNYGFVVGQYKDHATAEEHVDRHVCSLRRRPLYQNAMGYLMWEIKEGRTDSSLGGDLNVDNSRNWRKTA